MTYGTRMKIIFVDGDDGTIRIWSTLIFLGKKKKSRMEDVNSCIFVFYASLFLVTKLRRSTFFFPDRLELSDYSLLFLEWTVFFLDFTSVLACLIFSFFDFDYRAWTRILRLLSTSLWMISICNLFVSRRLCFFFPLLSLQLLYLHSRSFFSWSRKEFYYESSKASETISWILEYLFDSWRWTWSEWNSVNTFHMRVDFSNWWW